MACERADCPYDDDTCSEAALSFRCRVKSISYGYSYGKQNFHGPTIKERRDHQIESCAKAGVDIKPVETKRWV